jgi:cytochrome b
MNLVGPRYEFDQREALPTRPVKVWDLPVRIFHWLLVASIAVASVTGWLLPVSWLQIHLIAGTAIGFLVLWRLVWGFTGTRYSRFRSFIFHQQPRFPMSKGWRRKCAVIPGITIGSLMVFALLGSIGTIVLTGVAVLGGQLKQGPLKAFVSFAGAMNYLEIHSVVAVVLLVLVGGHLAGVIFESWRTRENLATAMVTGTKRDGFAHEAPMAQVRTGVAVSVSAVLAVFLIPGAYALTSLSPFGVAALPKNATWETECSSCHIAFHPSLLPAKSWAAIMSGLSQHFGEDASLDMAANKEITDYLVSHSAETWDSMAANRLRSRSGAPLEITDAIPAAPDHDISPAVFEQSGWRKTELQRSTRMASGNVRTTRNFNSTGEDRMSLSLIIDAFIGGLAVPVGRRRPGRGVALYKAQAVTADSAFAGFSADRGKALYASSNTVGSSDTPSCSSCHTASPLKTGMTRAGKAIEPMAVSVSPARFTDAAKTEKWFGRNCKSVLGRECSAQEKGDFITYLSGL